MLILPHPTPHVNSFLAKATKQRPVIDETAAKLKTLSEIVVCRRVSVWDWGFVVLRFGWLASLGVPWMLYTGAVVVLLGVRWGYLGVVMLPVSGHLLFNFPPVLS